MDILLASLILLFFILLLLNYVKLYGYRKMGQIPQDQHLVSFPSPETKYINQQFPDLELYSFDDKPYNIKHLSRQNLLLIVIDTNCAACIPSIENFLIESSSLPESLKYCLVINESNKDKSKEIYSLFCDDFLLLKGNIKELHVPFFPAYIYLDKFRTIKYMTSIPKKMVSIINSNTF